MYNQDKHEYNNSEFKNPAGKFSAFCFEWLESIVQAIIVIVIVLTFLFRVVNISGPSMEKTLFDGDKVVVWKWSYEPTKGDVVIISKGQHLDEPIVKRVIATQGDTLEIDFSDGSVIVNNKKLDETYIKEPMWVQGDGEIPSVIPQGYTFVMGDNRNHSMDSRFEDVGLIDNEDIVGKANFIIFPFGRFGGIH